MKRTIIIVLILVGHVGYGQNVSDTINFLKRYSQNYLELLFNRRNIDSVMKFWSKGMTEELKTYYSDHKQACYDDSTLKVLFAEDINTFCKRVTGKIEFLACDDKQGTNIRYFKGDEGLFFVINYSFYGDFESHNLLMQSFLDFQSYDNGKTWVLVQDTWISNYMAICYFSKDHYGKKPGDQHQ